MAIVQQVVDARMGAGVADVELGGADGVGLHANAEDLALHAVDDAGELLLEDLVQALFQAQARGEAVGGHVLVAVRDPDVAQNVVVELPGDVGGDAAALDAVAHPERAHVFLRGGEGEIVLHHGMAEEGGVEVDAQTVFTGELDPRIEVMGLDLVAVHLLAGGEDGVAGVQADALFAGHEAHGLDKVRLQFLEGAGSTGVVARGLDAAGKGAAAAFKADDVVALPAVDADGHVLQGGEGCFHIHAPRLVALLRALVALAHDDLILSAFSLLRMSRPVDAGKRKGGRRRFFPSSSLFPHYTTKRGKK